MVQNSRLMNRFMQIARSATPCAGVQFRKTPYRNDGVREFLRDVMALANANVEGPRYIVVGVTFDDSGHKLLFPVEESDFSGSPSYSSLVGSFIEPPLRLKYQPVSLSGKRVGVFEIADCQDRPYMMKADYSERLRRGDAYTAVNGKQIKMGRRQLLEMFERKFRESVSADRIEIGFPGEIIHKDCRIGTVDLSTLPSAIASGNLQQLIDTQQKSQRAASSTAIVRLTHARLFGSDSPYEDKSPTVLYAEMANLKNKYKFEDQYYLFEKNASTIQLVIYNQGDEPIQDASLVLAMPNHNDFHVATALPKIPRAGKFIDSGANKLQEYPVVTLKDDAVHVTNTLGEVPVDSMIQAFDTPLRICVGSELKGRKLGIRYALYGSNLRRPATGKLRLIF